MGYVRDWAALGKSEFGANTRVAMAHIDETKLAYDVVDVYRRFTRRNPATISRAAEAALDAYLAGLVDALAGATEGAATEQ